MNKKLKQDLKGIVEAAFIIGTATLGTIVLIKGIQIFDNWYETHEQKQELIQYKQSRPPLEQNQNYNP